MAFDKREIKTIERRDRKMKKFEVIDNTAIYIKPSRFRCVNCNSQMMTRSNQYGRNNYVKFRCKRCNHTSKYIHDIGSGKDITFDEYSKIMTEIVDRHRENEGERFTRKSGE